MNYQMQEALLEQIHNDDLCDLDCAIPPTR